MDVLGATTWTKGSCAAWAIGEEGRSSERPCPLGSSPDLLGHGGDGVGGCCELWGEAWYIGRWLEALVGHAVLPP